MCSSISWEQFILTIVVIVGGYYGYVGVSYYRTDWWYRLSAKPSPKASAQAAAAVPAAVPTGPNPLLPLVHDAVDEIRALLQAEGNPADKDDLQDKLRRLLQKYPALKGTPFQPSINQLIAVDTDSQCSVELSPDAIDGLWE